MSHDLFSPSKRHRWGRCPGSVREEAAYPPGAASSKAAIDGTHSHALLERCVKDGLIDPRTLIGHTLTDHEGEFVVDADRAERVALAVDHIREISLGGLLPVLAETRVDPAPVVLLEGLSGTVDVQVHGLTEMHIIDFKDGMHDAWDSAALQMEQYAVGALAQMRDHVIEVVHLTVIQPKLRVMGVPAVRSITYSVDQILGDVARELLVEVGRAKEPDAPLIPGEMQCRWCAHKGACSALASAALAPLDLGDLTVDAARADPTSMDDDRIRQVLEAAPLVRQLIDAVEAEALRRMKSGHNVPGLKLVNGKGSRAWALPEDEIAQKLIRMGLPKGSVWQTKLVSPAQAEKAVWTKKDGTEMRLSDRQIQTLQREYVVKMGGSVAVALAADSRPAVTFDASSLFGAVQST